VMSRGLARAGEERAAFKVDIAVLQLIVNICTCAWIRSLHNTRIFVIQ
jgi:hypothetical protein